MAHRAGGLSVEQEPVAWQVMVEDEPMKEFSIKEAAHDWAVTEKRNGSNYSYWIRPLYAAPMSIKPENIDTKVEHVDGVNIEPVAEVNLAKAGYINWLKLPPEGLNGGELLYTAPPDDLLRQSEREGWRWARECEDEVKRLRELVDSQKPAMWMLSKGQEPFKREWQGLTDVEVGKYSARLNGGDIAREVEALLRERNNG
jgi:hypothetical protein